jgi:hypothetical protein
VEPTLTLQNYRDRFHQLLYMEEIRKIVIIHLVNRRNTFRFVSHIFVIQNLDSRLFNFFLMTFLWCSQYEEITGFHVVLNVQVSHRFIHRRSFVRYLLLRRCFYPIIVSRLFNICVLTGAHVALEVQMAG